ncbi:lipopolysaccharide biosynthesis protein, partial [Faecalibacillus faecis]|uniref:lipopolysaccharide biosynthesis protein n=1 Tax=Faecalibacillus faecis TaxID=1982628 RepID=UPI003AB49356
TCIYVCFLSISNQYAFDKTVIVFLMCYLKLIDSVEDVFHGMYQQHERLDVASKCMSIRLILSTVFLCMCSIIFKDLLISSIITCVFSTLIFVYLLKITYSIFNLPKIQFDFFNAKRILKDCFPIFAGSFLSFYILNAPKYAIDALLSSELQAYYGFISMPVFVIGLLNNFVFQPILTTVANCYETKNKDQFFQLIKRQIVVILIITIVALIGSYVLGIPVLSILYNCDLSNYKVDLLILMLGGGILAYVGFLTTIITLMRNQNIILIGYVIGGVLAIVLSQLVVSLYGLRGASILYLLLISVLAVFFSIAFYFNLKIWKEGITNEG